MLAPLGFYLLFMITACSAILWICWIYDTAMARGASDRSRCVGSGLVLNAIHKSPGAYDELTNNRRLDEKASHTNSPFGRRSRRPGRRGVLTARISLPSSKSRRS